MVVAAALTGVAPGPAHGSVEAIAPQGMSKGGPLLAGPDLIWGRARGSRAVDFRARPLAGGRTQTLGSLRAPGRYVGFDLAGRRGALGVSFPVTERTGRLLSLPGRVFAGTVPNGPLSAPPPLQSSALGVITHEGRSRRTLVLRPPGAPSRRLVLPRGADPENVVVAGGLAAVPIVVRRNLRRVDVLDLATGRVTRRVAYADGAKVDAELLSLGMGADGSLAATVSGGLQGSFLHAPPGAVAFGPGAGVDPLGALAPAGNRLAMVVEAGGGGLRVIVVEARRRRSPVLFRGPVASQIGNVQYDGTHLVWSSGFCQFVARVRRGASRLDVPRGPCVRTDVTTTEHQTSNEDQRPPVRRTRRGRQIPYGIDCLTGPGGRCRVRVRVSDGRGKVIGGGRATVPRGPRRTVWIPLRPRARVPESPLFERWLRDPGGRTVYDF